MVGTNVTRPLTRSQQKEGAEIRELRTRLWTVHITCQWCGKEFAHTLKAGQKPRYCSPDCRQSQYNATRRHTQEIHHEQ